MRKVKVLAFVLAALMVVAAFAGCGTKQLKTDVTTLDERVTALEALLKQVNETVNGGATKDDINELLEAITANKAEAAAGDKALADAIAKITADQTAANDKLKTDLEKLVNDAKSAQTAGDTALQVAIEKLNNSLADTNKALADSVADLLDEIKDGDEDLADALADTNKALADAIASINKAQDEQGKDVADALAATNKALEDAIKTLQDSVKTGDDAVRAELIAAIEALTQKQEEQNSAIADALAKLEETIAKNQEQAGANADLQSAINLYVGNLTVSKNDYTADSISYTAEENLAIAALHSNGIAAVQAATKVEDAKKAYDDTVAGLAKYTAKDDQLYQAVVALKGNLTKGTRNQVADLVKLNTAVQKHYNDQGVDLKILKKYVGADGKEINLINEVANINTYQSVVNTYVADKNTSGSIARLVADIDSVEYVLIANHKVGDKMKYNNVGVIASYKERYNVFEDAISGKQASAAYISDSVLDLVTNIEALNAYVAKADGLATAKATLASYGKLNTQGRYESVFAEYAAGTTSNPTGILNVDSASANWWNKVEVYDTISARIDAWLADNPVVDEWNTHAIINSAYQYYTRDENADLYTFYADYLKNEEEANLFLDKYDEYVDNILPQVTTIEEIEEVTTANVQKFAEIDELIAAWRIVKEDGDDKDKNPDLVIESDQFDAMLAEMYGDELEGRTFANPFWFVEQEVRDWFNATVADAKAVANNINKQIETLISKEAKALSVIEYRTLEGYVPAGKLDEETKAQNYKMSTATVVKSAVVANGEVVEGVVPTIYQFKKLFVEKDKYDLTYLLDLDKFAASLAVAEANVNSYKTITDKIDGIVADIVADLTVKKVFQGFDKVSLQNEADSNKLKEAYTELIAKGYKYEDTYSWGQAYDEDGEEIKNTYTYAPLMVSEDYYTVTGIIGRVDDLRTMAKNLITFFEKINLVNTKKALTVAKCDTELAIWKTEKRGTGTNEKTYNWYIKIENATNVKLGERLFTVAYAQDTTTAASTTNAMTQQDAVDLAWRAYAQFTKDNQGFKDDAVESALLLNNLDDLRLIAIKADAYNNVEWMVAPGNENPDNKPVAVDWKTSYGDFYVQQTAQLNGIVDATSLENVANILYGFRQMTGVSYNDVTFANELIFHANGHCHLEGDKITCPETEYHPSVVA